MLAKDKYNANTTDQRLQSGIHCLNTTQSGSLSLPTASAVTEPPPWSGRITCGGQELSSFPLPLQALVFLLRLLLM